MFGKNFYTIGGFKMSYFEEMDDMEFGAKLFESEMETEVNEEEIHAQRCVAKGKRAKQLKTNNIIWHRNRDCEHTSDPFDKLASDRRNAKARRDTLNLRHEAMTVNPEEYDTVDTMPVKARRY